jgi:ferric-dicitrate binding protein FerR (iron transport regulator)
MGNKNKNKYEDFASYFHDEKEKKLTDNVRSDADFKVTQKIYNLHEKVGLLRHLSQVEDAWKKIEWKLKEKNPFWISRNFRAFRYAAIFIVLIALAGVVGIFLFQSPQNDTKEIFTEIITSTGEMKEVSLPDGSNVWIGANSILKYDNGFGQENRDIIFSGEAMFDVEKDDRIPFLVKLDDASVKVHGTKFLVTGYSAGNKNEIILLEGKIKYHRKNQAYNLSPGERISDNRLTGETIKDQIELENYREWMNGKIYLDNSELDDLTFLLEQWYEAKFTFGNEGLKNYKFTGVIDKRESLDYNLNIISLTNKVKFQKYEHGIVIINN